MQAVEQNAMHATFLAALGDMKIIDDAGQVKRKSRDFYWFSPILKAQLDDMAAEFLACPETEAEVICVAAACARAGMPLTQRGGGTGNYGQAVPLQGGVVLEMTRLDQIIWLRDGVVRVQAGKKMLDLDRELRAQGWELRMWPSTKRTATIGGFICGGSGGIGSLEYGFLGELGAVIGARVVSLEETPRVVELRGRGTNLVNHTYGTTGIVTEVELPVRRAMPWRDVVVEFDDIMEATRFAYQVAANPALEMKMCTVIDARLVPFFKPLSPLVSADAPLVLLMAAPSAMTALAEIADLHGGTLMLDVDAIAAEADPLQTPLYEYTWNHTTLWVLKQDRSFTYTQLLHPAAQMFQGVADMRAIFADELLTHLEFVRVGEQVTASSLPVIRYTTEARLNEIMAIHEASGISVANPHVVTLEDGSRHKRVPGDQIGFKRSFDPQGLLNPGKMRSFSSVPSPVLANAATVALE